MAGAFATLARRVNEDGEEKPLEDAPSEANAADEAASAVQPAAAAPGG